MRAASARAGESRFTMRPMPARSVQRTYTSTGWVDEVAPPYLRLSRAHEDDDRVVAFGVHDRKGDRLAAVPAVEAQLAHLPIGKTPQRPGVQDPAGECVPQAESSADRSRFGRVVVVGMMFPPSGTGSIPAPYSSHAVSVVDETSGPGPAAPVRGRRIGFDGSAAL